MMTMSDQWRYVFFAKTLHVAEIGKIITCLSKIMNTFRMHITSKGINITEIDKAQISICDIAFEAGGFEYFYFQGVNEQFNGKEDKNTMSIKNDHFNLTLTVQELKNAFNATKTYTELNLYVLQSELNRFYLDFKNENNINMCVCLNTLDIPTHHIDLNKVIHNCFDVNVDDLTTLCKNLRSVGDSVAAKVHVDVKHIVHPSYVGQIDKLTQDEVNKLLNYQIKPIIQLKTIGPDGCVKIAKIGNAKYINPDKGECQVLANVTNKIYSFYYLQLITSTFSLSNCHNLNIYLTKDHVLILRYIVALLGTVRFYLTPLNADK